MNIVDWGANADGESGAGFRSGPVREAVAAKPIGNVRELFRAYYCQFALLEDGTIRSVGAGERGEHGDGMQHNSTAWVTPKGLPKIKQLAVGGASWIALDLQGRVWTCGPAGGQHLVPVLIPSLSGVVLVAAGSGTFAALCANGDLYLWGNGKHGEIGDGTGQDKATPTLVLKSSDVVDIVVGGTPSFGGATFLRHQDGSWSASGHNGAGQLFLGHNRPVVSFTDVPALKTAVEVAAGVSATYARFPDGSVLAVGQDGHGERGAGMPVTGFAPTVVKLKGKASQIAAGQWFGGAIVDGHVELWGDAEHGKLASGAEDNSNVPLRVAGIEGATLLTLGEFGGAAVINGPAPAPVITATSAKGGVLVEWHAPEAKDEWAISTAPEHSKTFTKIGSAAAAKRSYMVPTTVPVSIRVKRKGWMRIVSGQPS